MTVNKGWIGVTVMGLSLSNFKRTIDDLEAKANGFTDLAVFL